jgi:hypothetical protein
MPTTAEELNLRLFLEGQEVPVISANVSMSSDFPATASVQVIATPEAFRLKTRTLVHLFFLDKESRAKLPLDNISPSPYSLLFCGEVLSINFSKTESSRSLTLSCHDHRSYYDQANTQILQANNIADTADTSALEQLLRSRGAFAGANSSLSFLTEQGLSGFISETFKDGTAPISPQFMNYKGILGGIIKMIEKFTGLLDIRKGGANAFFSFAAARLNLLGQIGVYTNDTTAAKLLASQSMMSLLKNKGDQLGELVSLNDIMRYVLGFVYYKMSPNACARFMPAESFDMEAKSPASLNSAATNLKVKLINIKNALSHIHKNQPTSTGTMSTMLRERLKAEGKKVDSPYHPNDIIKRALPHLQDILNLAPDSLRSGANSLLITELGSHPTTRSGWGRLSEETWPKDKELYTFLNEIAKLVAARDATATNVVGYGTRVIQCMHSLVVLTRPMLGVSVAGFYLQVGGVNVNEEILEAQRGRIARNEYSHLISEVINILTMAEKPITTKFKQLSSQKLLTTFIFPDLFFGVAPTSNVVFPDMYYTLSYGRNMQEEVTRFQLSTSEDTALYGVSAVGKEIYYAPSTEDLSSVQGEFLNDANAAEGAWTGNRLLDHELMSGIKPQFSQMNRMELETALLDQQNKEKLKHDFYLRIANYQFLKQRLSARQLSVSGIFNPSATVGLPCVVIDAAYDIDTRNSGEQFIGLLSTVNHSISQQGGATSYQISYARPHRSLDDEFINKVSLGAVTPTTKNLVLNYSKILSDIADAVDEGSLNAALGKMRLLCQVSGYTGTVGVDYFVEDKGRYARPTEEGSGITLGFRTPISPGRVKPGFKIPFEVGGKRDLKVFGVIVVDPSRAGGSNDVLGETMADVIQRLGGIPAQEAVEKFYEYVLELAGMMLHTVADKFPGSSWHPLIKDPSFDNFFISLHRSLQALTRNSRTPEYVSLPIRNIEDEDLALICLMHYHGGEGRFLFNGFQEVEIIYESGEEVRINPPIEEAMRPAFIDVAYASPNIGEKVYKELLGVGSIVDVEDAELEGTNITKGTTTLGYISESAKTSSMWDAVKVLSQEDAIDFICSKYARTKNKGDFARNYVRREFANINDVIGSVQSIHYKAYSTSNDDTESKRIPYMGVALEVTGNNPLPEGLREATPAEIEVINRTVDPRVDVRSLRADAVVDYINSLTSRGLI